MTIYINGQSELDILVASNASLQYDNIVLTTPFDIPVDGLNIGVDLTIDGPSLLTLPTGITNGKMITVSDIKGDSFVNNITINAGTGQTIDGISNAVLSRDHASITMTYIASKSKWKIV